MIIWSRVKNFFRYYFGGLGAGIDEYHILLLGGGLAFSVLLCVIPLILVIISLLGSVLEASSVESQVGTLIDTVIPYPHYATYVKDIIFSRINEVIIHKKLAGYIGVAGLLIAASSLFSSMRTALNTIFGGRAVKPLVIGKLRDIGMILLVLTFFLISTTILPVLEVMKESALQLGVSRYLGIETLLGSSFSIATYFIVFSMFFILYYLLPYEHLGKRVVAVSAFWATVLWEFARQGFGYYIANFALAGKIFGTYVVAVMVILWIYFSAIVFILAASIGRLYRERRMEREVAEREV